MTLPSVPRYGVKETTPSGDELDTYAEECRIAGYTVIDSGLDRVQIEAIGSAIDRVIALQEAEMGGSAAMGRIGEAGTGRALLAYDDIFLDLMSNPKLIGLVERLLGDYFVLSQQNSIVLEPHVHHNQAQYHRDLPYQHFVSSRPLAVNALFCVDPFTEENGATRVIPGSHKHEPFPADPVVARLERVATAPAGSFIVQDAMVFHSGGENRTNKVRRAVNHVFVLPFLRQQINLPRMLDGRFSDDPRVSRLLGYDCQTPDSVLGYRRGRLDRLGG
ncbi:MAG: phytanoyl-CoA dioxygenase [Acetobacteraceae bacterium]|nr:phytanoyl-CoA dioxygenase [Acetobacteraceae bacterium]